MTTAKLPPLADHLRAIAARQNPYHTAPIAEALVDLAEDLAPRYDTLIREQDLRIEVLQNSAREREAVVEDLEAENARLKDELTVLNQDFAERMAKFRELASAAACAVRYLLLKGEHPLPPLLTELAAMHQESTDG